MLLEVLHVKPVPAGFVDWLLSAQQMLIAELYTFRLITGQEFNFTSSDFDFGYGDKLWSANSVRFDAMKSKLQVGITVDEQEIKAAAYPTDTLNGNPFFVGLQEGLFDGAQFIRQRAFWQIDDGRPWVDYQTSPKGVITIFTGYVSEISKIGRTMAEIKVKSPLKFLDIEMPRNTFQASCQWTLYDAGCTLNRGSFTTGFTTVSANLGTITVSAIGAPVGGDGAPSYQQGRLLFTSGANNGLQTLIGSNDSTTFFLQYPLRIAPSPGDTFAASQGCLKTEVACRDKFGNINNFRGFLKVPPVHISI